MHKSSFIALFYFLFMSHQISTLRDSRRTEYYITVVSTKTFLPETMHLRTDNPQETIQALINRISPRYKGSSYALCTLHNPNVDPQTSIQSLNASKIFFVQLKHRQSSKL